MGHKKWDMTERLTLFTLAPFLVFYAFLRIKRWGAGKLHFSELCGKMDSLQSLLMHNPGRKWEGRTKGKSTTFSLLLLAVPPALQQEWWWGETKTRKIPGLILRNTVLTMPGGGYDGGNHSTAATRLWARILVIQGKNEFEPHHGREVSRLPGTSSATLWAVIFPYYSSSPESTSFLYLLITLDPHIPLIFPQPFHWFATNYLN